MNRGCSLPELLLGAALLTLLASVSFGSGVSALARQRLEGASRRLSQGLEEARAAAEQRGEACAIRLLPGGWSTATSALPSCLPAAASDGEGFDEAQVQLSHNLPAQVRINANGLPIDGGTVVIRATGTSEQRCLVLSLPLGVVRLGRYSGASGGLVSSAACQPDPSLQGS